MSGIEHLKEDHKKLIFQLQKILNDFQDSSLDIDLYNNFQARLKDHIYEEETNLYSKLNRYDTNKDKIIGFETEHAAMWKLMGHINDEIETGRFIKIEKYFDELLRILSQHSAREEQYIYSNIDDYTYTNLPRTPEWVCRKIRSTYRSK